jgi:bifunctional DNA-binding transcriptional regulator/antitoxin component of YhaV-PrlF toxin-antitoxin module
MEHSTIARITTSGQVSLPAPVRKRWGATRVVIVDEGAHLVVRPLPNDPIAAACGSLKRGPIKAESVRASERDADAGRQRRRLSR